jgi:hypothetical protein
MLDFTGRGYTLLSQGRAALEATVGNLGARVTFDPHQCKAYPGRQVASIGNNQDTTGTTQPVPPHV